MTPRDPLRTDLVAARYLDALERGDAEITAALWKQAGTDPALEVALRQVHAGLIEEQAMAEVETVAAAAEAHLVSGQVARPVAGPVTVADVANELFRHTPDRLPAEAHALNSALRSARDPLPSDLGLPQLVAWAEAKYGAAPAEYWRAFRQAAVKVRMRSNSEAEFGLAARQSKPKPGESR